MVVILVLSLGVALVGLVTSLVAHRRRKGVDEVNPEILRQHIVAEHWFSTGVYLLVAGVIVAVSIVATMLGM